MLASALTSFKQPAIIKKALNMIPTDTIRRQDAMYWLAYSFANHHAKRAAWDWMVKHWDWLDKELGSDLSFYRTPLYAGRSFSEPEFKTTYHDFFKDKKSPGLDRSIKQGAEMLAWQIGWKQRELQNVQTFLN